MRQIKVISRDVVALTESRYVPTSSPSTSESLSEDVEIRLQLERTDDATVNKGPTLVLGHENPPFTRNGAGAGSEETRKRKRDDDDDGTDDDISRKRKKGDDEDSTSDNWDGYGSVPDVLGEYTQFVAGVDGSSTWNEEQRKLYKLLYMRGQHPMIPSWWSFHFMMWGINPDVYAPVDSQKRVAIRALGNEVVAAKALESLFYLSQMVADYEEIGCQDKIAPTVVKTLQKYIKWAHQDAGVDELELHPIILVEQYNPGEFRGKSKNDNDKDDVDHFLLTDIERQERFTKAVSADLQERLSGLGQLWRQYFCDEGDKGDYTARKPPTLYAFAVVQHIVMLVSQDAGDSSNPIVIMEQLRLNDKGLWLWNALSIALPVNMVRDALHSMWTRDVDVRPSVEKPQNDDPDI